MPPHWAFPHWLYTILLWLPAVPWFLSLLSWLSSSPLTVLGPSGPNAGLQIGLSLSPMAASICTNPNSVFPEDWLSCAPFHPVNRDPGFQCPHSCTVVPLYPINRPRDNSFQSPWNLWCFNFYQIFPARDHPWSIEPGCLAPKCPYFLSNALFSVYCCRVLLFIARISWCVFKSDENHFRRENEM